MLNVRSESSVGLGRLYQPSHSRMIMIWNSKWHRQFSFSLPLLFPLNLPVLPNRKWAGKKGKERKKKKKKKTMQAETRTWDHLSCHCTLSFFFQPCMCIIISRPNMRSICFVAAQLAPDPESRFYLPSTACPNNVKLIGILLVNFILYPGNFIAIAGIIMHGSCLCAWWRW